ncbi:MAG TPA: HD domain-containing protein [bacterium]|nr:HD domain-containing protein [bacterium]
MHNLLAFIADVERLKRIDRTGYALAGIPDPESVAEHSFGVVWYALLIAAAEHADRAKVLQMALLHDLAEARVGDIPQPVVDAYLGEAEKRRLERAAFNDIIAPLADGLRDELSALFEEFEAGETLEARVVRDADRLQMLGQVLTYEENYDLSKGNFWECVPAADWLPSSGRLASEYKKRSLVHQP